MAANNDIIEYTLVWDYQGSTILNVYHFQLREFTGSPDTELLMGDLNTWMQDNVWGEDPDLLMTHVVNTMTLVETRGQVVFPNRDRYYSFDQNIPGLVDEAGIPSNLALVLTAQTDGTARGTTGSKHFTGFPVSELESEFWADGLRTDLATAHDAMLPAIVNADPAGQFVPVTFSPVTGVVHDIVDWRAIPVARVMRRRTKGYGI